MTRFVRYAGFPGVAIMRRRQFINSVATSTDSMRKRRASTFIVCVSGLFCVCVGFVLRVCWVCSACVLGVVVLFVAKPSFSWF